MSETKIIVKAQGCHLAQIAGESFGSQLVFKSYVETRRMSKPVYFGLARIWESWNLSAEEQFALMAEV